METLKTLLLAGSGILLVKNLMKEFGEDSQTTKDKKNSTVEPPVTTIHTVTIVNSETNKTQLENVYDGDTLKIDLYDSPKWGVQNRQFAGLFSDKELTKGFDYENTPITASQTFWIKFIPATSPVLLPDNINSLQYIGADLELRIQANALWNARAYITLKHTGKIFLKVNQIEASFTVAGRTAKRPFGTKAALTLFPGEEKKIFLGRLKDNAKDYLTGQALQVQVFDTSAERQDVRNLVKKRNVYYDCKATIKVVCNDEKELDKGISNQKNFEFEKARVIDNL